MTTILRHCLLNDPIARKILQSRQSVNGTLSTKVDGMLIIGDITPIAPIVPRTCNENDENMELENDPESGPQCTLTRFQNAYHFGHNSS